VSERDLAIDSRTDRLRSFKDAFRRLAGSSVIWILLVLVVLVVVFTAVTPPGSFASFTNSQNILADAATTLVLAAGVTPLIIGGGLDISVGSVMTFSAVVTALVMKDISNSGTGHVGVAIVVGVLAGIGAGLAWGILNGLLIAVAGISPFIVTLGSLGAALGAARLLSGGIALGGVPERFQSSVGISYILRIPTPFVIGAIIAGVLGLMLAVSKFGEHTYLLGSSEEAAYRSGINVRRQKIMLYAIAGLAAGVAGVLDVAQFEIADVSSGHTTELLAALSAVFIGGASLYGGVGTMIGSVIGVFIPAVLRNGLVIAGSEAFWQDVVVGIILVASVGLDQWRRRSAR
jgi:ribose transport system permease protein